MIYPVPISEEYFEGKNIQTKITYDADLLDFYNRYANSEVTYQQNVLFEPEQYELLVSETGVTITYATEQGKFRALTSLRQLIDAEGIQLCKIADKPMLERRGYMLDISRSRIPTMETILSLVDMLADLKYNEFQLYMDSFCYKYEAFPEYTKDFDCLTPEDLDYLDEYCAQRFIDLVPNQNGLGHMAAWLKKDELKHLALQDEESFYGTLNPLDPGSIELMDKIYGSLLPHFRSKYIHVGLDEAGGLGKCQTKEASDKYGVDQVFVDYLTKINDLANKYGKEIQFWDDMIIEYPDSFPKFPKNVTAIEWGYGIISTQFMEERCRVLADKGVRFYVGPGNANWVSLTSRVDIMEFNVRSAAELAVKYGAAGFLLTDWACGEGHPHYLVHSYFPCAMGGQYAWNAGVPQNRINFKHEFRYAAMDYLDRYVFKCDGVTELMYRLGKYHHLEPHKCHGSTICCRNLCIPLTERKFFIDFDFDKYKDDFYFENIITYVHGIIRALSETAFDEQLKAEAILNADMIVLGAEICKIKTNKCVSEDKRAKLMNEIDRIISVHDKLWHKRNYHEGIDHFVGYLRERKSELAVY